MSSTEGDDTGDDRPVGAAAAELLADENRPGGWLLLVDRVRQSYVDLSDPTYLDFEYMQAFADVIEAMTPGPLRVVHVGGGGYTLARYIAARRPESRQVVFEPDPAVRQLVRQRLPLPRGARVRVRSADGVTGVAGLTDGGADVVVLDAFEAGQVPAAVTTTEFVGQLRRVLRPDGVLLVNFTDGPHGVYVRRLVATVFGHFSHVALVAEPAVLKLRRFGNIVLVGCGVALPMQQLRQACARALFPRQMRTGRELAAFAAGAVPLSGADSMRSPQPPEQIWRVG